VPLASSVGALLAAPRLDTKFRRRLATLVVVAMATTAVWAGVAVSRPSPASASTDPIPGGTVPVGPRPSGTRNVSLQFGGQRRSYLLVRPPGAHGSTPLVVLLHGTGASGAEEMARTGFGQLAEADGFTLAVPASIGPTWNSGAGCCAVAAHDHIDDPAFVHAVIADVTHEVAVDPRRIYLVGYSNGGKLSYGVSCTDALSKRPFAGLATYGAGPQLPCHDGAPLAVLAGYGAADHLEPAGGKPANDRGKHPGAKVTAADFRTRDHCTDAATHRRVGPADITTYAHCAAGTTVETAIWAHQTHTFPRSPAVPADAAGATVMWDFLRSHNAPARS
jgi:polyhydroxybutyrate depolymerase